MSCYLLQMQMATRCGPLRPFFSSLLRSTQTTLARRNAVSAAATSTNASESGQKMNVRDAINTALDEEISRDDKVFVIGEEVAQYEGPYKVRFSIFKTVQFEAYRSQKVYGGNTATSV